MPRRHPSRRPVCSIGILPGYLATVFGSRRPRKPFVTLAILLIGSSLALTLSLVTELPRWIVIRDGGQCRGMVDEVLGYTRSIYPSVVLVQFEPGCPLSSAPVELSNVSEVADSDWYPGFEADFYVNPVDGWRGGVVPTAVLPEDTWGGIVLFSVTTVVLLLVILVRFLVVRAKRRTYREWYAKNSRPNNG